MHDFCASDRHLPCPLPYMPDTVLENILNQVITPIDNNADDSEDTGRQAVVNEPPAKRRHGPGKKNCKAHISTTEHYIAQLIIFSTTS